MSDEVDDIGDGGDSSTEEGNHASACIPGYKSLQDYFTEGYKVLTDGVKSSSSLPMGKNFLFYKSFTNFNEIMNECGTQIEDLMEKIITVEGLRRNIRNCTLEDAMDAMQDVNDMCLDRSRQTMDFMDGIKGNALLVKEVAGTVVSGAWNRATAPRGSDTLATQARGPPRPQFSFEDKPNNTNAPWEPKIREKPNALRPLAILPEFSDDGMMSWSHPYDYELEAFEAVSQLMEKGNPIKPKPIEDCPLIFVDSQDLLNSMMTDLMEHTIIGVDLEHHSNRSFQGFTCLIQISTKDTDYIVDALKLRSQLHVLNEVFTKTSILKVLHGADSDVCWLQRDFGVYLVGMFDTHQAAKLLSFPRLSLAYLLHHFCGVTTDKRYQLYDWRTRPLPPSAIQYARLDTHYLLFIYQCMANQLIDKAAGETNLLKTCFDRSTEICRTKYSKPEITEESYMMLYRKGKRMFDNRQLHALKGLYLWRDKVAREQDESIGYVLPNHMMLQIAETLPREAQGILACCNPVPPLVRANLLELHYIVVSAKEQPLVKVLPEMNPAPVDRAEVAVTAAEERRALDEWVFPTIEGTSLPTLLDSSRPASPSSETSSSPPPASIFDEEFVITMDKKFTDDAGVDVEVRERLRGVHFVSPYQRYLHALPYALQLEKEQREREAAEAERIKAEVLLRQQQGSLMNAIENDTGIVKLKREKLPSIPQKISVAEENPPHKKRRVASPLTVKEEPQSLRSVVNAEKRGRRRKISEVESDPEVPRPIKVKREDDAGTSDVDSHEVSERLQGGQSDTEMPKDVTATSLDDEFPNQKGKKKGKKKMKKNADEKNKAVSEVTPRNISERLEGELTGAETLTEELNETTVDDEFPNQEKRPTPKQKKIKKKFNNNSGAKQKQEDFKPFDYSKVDFSQFASDPKVITKKNKNPKKSPGQHVFGPKGKRKTDFLLGGKKKVIGKRKGNKK